MQANEMEKTESVNRMSNRSPFKKYDCTNEKQNDNRSKQQYDRTNEKQDDNHSKQQPCDFCGYNKYQAHQKGKCPAKGKVCKACDRKGHFAHAKVCQRKV